MKVDRKRKMPVTTLLRAIGYSSNEEIKALFTAIDLDAEHQYIQSTLDRDPTTNTNEGLVEVYKRLRPGDPPTIDNARNLVQSLFFNFRRYDLAKVGRYKLNRKLGLELAMSQRTLTNDDLVRIVGKIVELNNGKGNADDIDHLGNRRVRAVGELIQNQFRIGLLRMERVVRERMTIVEPEKATPKELINIRPVVAAIKEFFGGSQLSQFMDQTNPLDELTHKRRLSALGPGGLSRERAGFDVRDVHYSHYGRICPIETPEGPNIGLIGSLATYARVNPYGFIESPFRRVVKDGGKDRPRVSDEIVFLTADEQELATVVQANARLDDERPLPRRARAGPPRRRVPRGSAGERGLHGRVAEADRLRGGGAHPVPRARRREPRAHGLEHAAAGRAGRAPRGADHRHGHRVPRREGLRPGRPGASRAAPCAPSRPRRSGSRRTRATRSATSCRSSSAPTRAPASTSARW